MVSGNTQQIGCKYCSAYPDPDLLEKPLYHCEVCGYRFDVKIPKYRIPKFYNKFGYTIGQIALALFIFSLLGFFFVMIVFSLLRLNTDFNVNLLKFGLSMFLAQGIFRTLFEHPNREFHQDPDQKSVTSQPSEFWPHLTNI